VHHSNTKKIKKTTTFERMFGFDAKYVFFWFSLGFFLFFFGSEWKTFFFLNGHDQSRFQKTLFFNLRLFNAENQT